MIRGTTPTLSFALPMETELLAEVWITLSPQDRVVLDKKLKDCVCEGRELRVSLSQEETLKLQHGCNTEIQLRVRTRGGEALASRIFAVDTARILKDGVI